MPTRISAWAAVPGPGGQLHMALWEESGGGWYRGPCGGLTALPPGLSGLFSPVLWLQDAGLSLLAETAHGELVHWQLSRTGWHFMRSWSGGAWSAGRSGQYGLVLARAGGSEEGLWLWQGGAWHHIPPPTGTWERPLMVLDTTDSVTIVCRGEKLMLVAWDGNWSAPEELGDIHRGDFVNLLLEGETISVLWGQPSEGYTMRSGRLGGPWSSPMKWRSERSWRRPVRMLYTVDWRGPRAVYTDWPPGLAEPLRLSQAWRVAAAPMADVAAKRVPAEPVGMLANIDQRLRRLEEWAADAQHQAEPSKGSAWWRWLRRR